MTTLQPLRDPEVRSAAVMTRRAWFLVVGNVLLPGSAQLLAGNRRLGRIGLIATLVLWMLAIVALVTSRVNAPLLIGVAANSVAVSVLQVLALAFAALWVLLTLDTLRLTRFVRVLPSRRGWIAGFAVVLMTVTAGTAGYAAYLAGVQRTLLGGVFSGGVVRGPVDGRYNILILGGDAGPDRQGLRPDSLSLASIDVATGRTSIIGIPRNLMNAPFAEDSPMHEPFPGGYDCGECMINALYTYAEDVDTGLYPRAAAESSSPGIEATRDAVEGVTGLSIQYYVLIDMAGFEQLIDALGGIVVPVDKRLPIGGGEDENGQPVDVMGWIEPGTQHMDGRLASWYSRARHGTSDYDRMARQRNVQQAILEQFEPVTVLGKFEAIAEAGTQVISTDIPEAQLAELVTLAGKARTQDMDRLELVPPTYDVTDPDYEAIHRDVSRFLAPAA